MGSSFRVLAPVFGSGYRRRRDEDDINDLGSSPSRKRKICPTVDLTQDRRLSRMTRSLSIENECPHSMSNFQFEPWIHGSRPRAQQCVQPTNRITFENERTAWYNSPNQSPSTSRTGMFDIPGLRKDWATSSLNESRDLSPRIQPSYSVIKATSPRAISTPSTPRRAIKQTPLLNPTTPNRAQSPTYSRPCATATAPSQPIEKHVEVEIESVTHNGHTLRARKTVELEDGTFLRIASIINRISDHGEDQVFLEGIKYQRAREFLGLLALKKNEVALSSVCEKIPLSEVLKPRILIVTNAAFPKYRDITGDDQVDEREGRLICRWRLNVISKHEGYIWRLEEHEVDKEYRVEDSELRESWRGRFVQFTDILEGGVPKRNPHKDLRGERELAERSAKIVDLTSPEPDQQKNSIKETSQAEVTANEGSINLEETSYGPYRRGGSSLAGQGSSYEATIDSRTHEGKFLSYFQRTYTPSSSPRTPSKSSLPSLCSSPGGFSRVSSQSSKGFSSVSSPQSLGRPVGGAGFWSSNQKRFGLFNASPFDSSPIKQRYYISGGHLAQNADSFNSQIFHRDISSPTRYKEPGGPFLRLYPSSERFGFSASYSSPISQPSTPTKRGIPTKPFFSGSMTSQASPSRGNSEKHRYLQDLDNFLKEPPPPQPIFSASSSRRKYKFGDAFCGGGGMSCGARSAGLVNTWSFDFNIDAVETYRKNFPDCETYHASASDFVVFSPEELLVDVVHLSPPCQPHSPAHTIAGKDDDRNEASLFCIKECLEAARPRVVTLEQTDGILNRQEWFRSLVMCFTDLGFSVSWKVLHGVEYGVPQTRKRLFLLAASPGEVLPNFPAPKYANPRDKELFSRLPPPRTVRNAIGDIPYDSTSHNPIPFPTGFRPSPVDFDQPLKATILASGGPYDVHPSGLRPFTPRELACLQTFPITHDFSGSTFQRKKQIGNAVPPALAEALLREVRRTLERVDRERSKKAEKSTRKNAPEMADKRKGKELDTVIAIPDEGEVRAPRPHGEAPVVVVD